jgi:hypothetical protein
MSNPKRSEDAKDSLLHLLKHTKIAIEELKNLEKSALVALRGIGENKLDTERFHGAIDNIKETGKLSSQGWRVAIREIKDSSNAILVHLNDARSTRI